MGTAGPGCRACGAELPADARWCPACGARTGAPPLIELETLDPRELGGTGASPGGGPPPRRAGNTGPSGPPGAGTADDPVGATRVEVRAGPRARWVGAAVAVVVLAVLATFAVVVGDTGTGDGGGGDGDGAAAPGGAEAPGAVGGDREPTTTTAAPAPGSAGSAGASAVPTRFLDVTPSTTQLGPVTAQEPVHRGDTGPPGAPLLGEEVGGWSLYVLSDGWLHRVELDTGRHTRVDLDADRSRSAWHRLFVAEDRVVLGGDAGAAYLPLDLEGPLTVVDPGFRSLGGPILDVESDGTVWLARWTSSPVVATRIDGADATRHELVLPSRSRPVGVLGGSVVIVAAGRIFLVDPTGEVTPYADGEVLGVNGDWMLWYGCDDGAACQYHVGSPGDPWHRTDVYPGVRAIAEAASSSSAIAPDGDTAVLVDLDRPRRVGHSTAREVVNLLDGSIIELSEHVDTPQFRPVWAPDGSWLFRFFPTWRIDAVDLRTGQVTDLGLGNLLSDRGNNAVAAG